MTFEIMPLEKMPPRYPSKWAELFRALENLRMNECICVENCKPGSLQTQLASYFRGQFETTSIGSSLWVRRRKSVPTLTDIKSRRVEGVGASEGQGRLP